MIGPHEVFNVGLFFLAASMIGGGGVVIGALDHHILRLPAALVVAVWLGAGVGVLMVGAGP